MNTAFEIAKRMSFQKSKTNTSFIVKLSIAATSISIAAIILTFSIVNGFQEQIAQKVYDFWGDINITPINGNILEYSNTLEDSLKKIPGVKIIQPYAIQTAILSYELDMEGILVKGIRKQEIIPFEKENIRKKLVITSQHDIIVSDFIAKKLNLKLKSQVKLNFLLNGRIIERKFNVAGIYHSGIEDFDQKYVYTDIELLQNLNYNKSIISGYSINVKNKASSSKNRTVKKIQSICPPNTVATPIEEDYPQIFDWIGVQTVNRNVAVTIMLIIAIVNLITCLFILMLERVNTIGTLTAMGANHQLIRKVFLYQVSFISWIGIAIGCIVGLGLSLLQQYTGIIQLDEAAYFMKTLPIKIIPLQILLIILGTALISYISFLIPTIWIKKISPAKTIRFD